MNQLEIAIKKAILTAGSNHEANKAYLEFIKANFIIPIEKKSTHEHPIALYLEENGQIFLPVFTSMLHFDRWAKDIKDNIQLLKLSGVDLLKGVGKQVTISLNIGTKWYKEFNPSELERMKSIVLKLFK